MSGKPYDESSLISIYEYALNLENRNLSELIKADTLFSNSSHRGDLGRLLEEFYFNHVPPNDHNPDFLKANLELKTTGVIYNSKKELKAKERLVLSLINYSKICDETWEISTFINKNNTILLLFYLFEKNKSSIERIFILKPLLILIDSDLKPRTKSEIDFIKSNGIIISSNDLEVIKKDWEIIQSFVLQGRAHELSEGDTFYLGACRKGSGGPKESLQAQPYSDIKAKTRAFSFKQSYISKLVTVHSGNEASIGVRHGENLVDTTMLKFKPFLGKNVKEIEKMLSISGAESKQKNYLRLLANKMLTNKNNEVLELSKAGVEMKTIRLKKNGKPRESMSFPGFKYMEIIHETWEDSKFYEKLERKFLFVIFKEDEFGNDVFLKAAYWNMPYQDRLEAQKVWERTKKQVAVDASKLPKIGDSYVAHVRPKARNAKDKILTPQGNYQIKPCFWLNNSYIEKVITNL